MKFEYRVFQDDKAAPVHTETFDVENPVPKCHELAFKFHLGTPTYPVDYGFRYTNGYVDPRPLDK